MIEMPDVDIFVKVSEVFANALEWRVDVDGKEIAKGQSDDIIDALEAAKSAALDGLNRLSESDYLDLATP